MQFDEKGAGVEEMRAAVKELKGLIGTECTCLTGKALEAVADNLQLPILD